jgi:carboxyl-terminal processing protease
VLMNTLPSRHFLVMSHPAFRLMAIMFSLCVGVVWAQDVCAEPNPPEMPRPETPMAMPEDIRIGLFNSVSSAVRDFYLFEDFNGVDWEAVTKEFAPLVLETENAWAYYDILDRMVGILDDPLTTFANPLVLEAVAAREAAYGGIGALLDRAWVKRPGEALRVVAVFPDSPAEEAGLRPRDRILAVDDDACARVEIIRGPAETTVRLLVASPDEDPREIPIERGTVTALILPEVRRLGTDSAFGYLRLVSLSGAETLRAIEQAMAFFATPPAIEGLILDVRGTRTGAPGVLFPLLSYFLEGEVGFLYTRAGDSVIELPPAPLKRGFDQVPVVVLVDEATVAEAEQLAALLQSQGRAQVVGQPTSGVTHGVRNLDFVGGSLLQLTVIGLRLADGSVLERAGVTPDVLVNVDWAQYSEHNDPYIMKAFELLAKGRSGGNTQSSTRGLRIVSGGMGGNLRWTLAIPAIRSQVSGGASVEGASEQTLPEAKLRIEQLEGRIVQLLAELYDVRRERDRHQVLVELLQKQADPMEASRLLLIEMRKDIPESRVEAEFYLERIRTLGLIADPVRLGTLARRLQETTEVFLDWRHADYSSQEESSRALAETGAHGFPKALGKFRDAVLLSVSNRIEALLVLVE